MSHGTTISGRMVKYNDTQSMYQADLRGLHYLPAVLTIMKKAIMATSKMINIASGPG